MRKKVRRYRCQPGCLPLFCDGRDPQFDGLGSHSISGSQAREIKEAAAFAARCGFHFNVSLIFNPGDAGLKTAPEALEGFQKFLRLGHSWARSCGIPWVYIYVWEQGAERGVHCHIMLAVPPRLREAFFAWLHRPRRLTGKHANPHYIPSRIFREKRSELSQMLFTNYLCKAIDRKAKLPIISGVRGPADKVLKISRRDKKNFIPFKRTGVSQTIGRLSRARYERGIDPRGSLYFEHGPPPPITLQRTETPQLEPFHLDGFDLEEDSKATD